MNTGIEAFDRTLQPTIVWLKDLTARLGTEDRHLAYLALRTMLYALRDRLPVDEAAHLGAQLAMLVRGFYDEGWHPAGKPVKEHSKEAFLAHVRAESHALDFEWSRRRVVFDLLAERITAGEIEDVMGMLPKPVRELWPALGGRERRASWRTRTCWFTSMTPRAARHGCAPRSSWRSPMRRT